MEMLDFDPMGLLSLFLSASWRSERLKNKDICTSMLAWYHATSPGLWYNVCVKTLTRAMVDPDKQVCICRWFSKNRDNCTATILLWYIAQWLFVSEVYYSGGNVPQVENNHCSIKLLGLIGYEDQKFMHETFAKSFVIKFRDSADMDHQKRPRQSWAPEWQSCVTGLSAPIHKAPNPIFNKWKAWMFYLKYAAA